MTTQLVISRMAELMLLEEGKVVLGSAEDSRNKKAGRGTAGLGTVCGKKGPRGRFHLCHSVTPSLHFQLQKQMTFYLLSHRSDGMWRAWLARPDSLLSTALIPP